MAALTNDLVGHVSYFTGFPIIFRLCYLCIFADFSGYLQTHGNALSVLKTPLKAYILKRHESDFDRIFGQRIVKCGRVRKRPSEHTTLPTHTLFIFDDGSDWHWD